MIGRKRQSVKASKGIYLHISENLRDHLRKKWLWYFTTHNNSLAINEDEERLLEDEDI